MAATSTSFQQLIFWRFVQGLATPGIFGSAVAYIHEVWPPTHAGRAMAMYMTGTVLGGFTGRAVAGLVAADVSWPASFVALAIMNGAVALALFAWLPSETRHVRPMPCTRRGAFGHLFRNRRLVATYGVGFCVLFTQVAMFTYVTFHVAALPSFFWNAGGWPACVGLVVIVQAIGVAIALTQWSPAKGRYGEVIPEGV